MAVANQNPLNVVFKKGIVNSAFLRDIARFSYLDNGPAIAKEYLEKHGIHLIIVPHLSKTYLDGAAFMLPNGNPVVALTLRYDRNDNFWFCLLHELAHIGRHLTTDKEAIIFDDLDLRGIQSAPKDEREEEADKLAQEALIPNKAWKSIDTGEKIEPEHIKSLADRLKIHPAIIAGRIRYEKNNYRLFSSLIGNGEVRKQFPDITFN
jgi:HTH-type transcriptional regulator/antitoxin HigA